MFYKPVHNDGRTKVYEQHNDSYIFEGHAFFLEKKPTLLDKIKKKLRK